MSMIEREIRRFQAREANGRVVTIIEYQEGFAYRPSRDTPQPLRGVTRFALTDGRDVDPMSGAFESFEITNNA